MEDWRVSNKTVRVFWSKLMRVAMIVNSFPSISERFLINTVTALLDRGIDIDVYAAVPSSEAFTHDIYAQYRLDERCFQLNIQLSFMRRNKAMCAILAKSLFSHPLKTLRAFSLYRYRRAAQNLKNIFFLDAFIGKKYDIIHCQFGQNGLIGSYLKDCGFCDKLVVTFHGSDITVFPKKAGKNVYRYMFSRADAITAGTSFTAGFIKAHGCPPDKVHILPVGIIPENYPVVAYESRDEFLLLSVGRLEEVKGFCYAIKAFVRIAKEYPRAVYIIAGAGSWEKELRSIATAEGLAERVLFVGEKKDTEIAELYQKASVFLAPSIRASNGSEEGQGLVVQEAQASGLPVIGTLTGGIPDGIKDGSTGFLVHEKDPEALAERIRYLFDNPDVRKEIGQRSREHAIKNYSMANLTEKLVSLYRENTIQD